MLRICILLLFLANSAFAQNFTKTQVVTGLPWAVSFDFAPDGRIFATKKGGWANQSYDASIKVYDQAGVFLNEFCDLSDSITAAGEYGMIGVAIDPNFTQNHFVYCYYTYSDDPANGGNIHLRVQRFTESNNIGLQPAVLLDLDVADTMPRSHVGGNIHFRPSDSTHIYVTIGDMRTGDDGYDDASRLDKPIGKILRISKYPNSPPPSDNPFYDDGNPLTGNCDYIWAYGFRNSFDFCFGPNDSLYATENGTTYYDEVNLVTRGGFYGWPECEGNFDKDTISLPCHSQNVIAPLTTFPFPLPSLTGIVFYNDTVWSSQQNNLIVGDFNHADLNSLYMGNAPAFNTVDSTVFWIDESNLNGITCLKQGSDGCIYVMEIGDTVFGGIYKICPVGSTIAEPYPEWSLNVGPNPFTTSTTIRYSLGESAHVRLTLYDALGREVELLSDESQTSGAHNIEVNTQKFALSSGIYICTLHSEKFTQSIRLIVE